jgi:pimeloyl-ACP methyl ester carboxylesterase
MPYARNQGIRIHYRVEGEGPALVLQHGFTSSGELFRKYGYMEALRNDYLVISIDARGHGASDKPSRPEAYRLACLVDDVCSVLDTLNVSKTHFFGYSRGGRTGFAMAKYAPERLFSLIIGGAHPYAEPFDSFRHIDGTNPEAFLAALEELIGENLEPDIKALVVANNLKALAAAARPEPGIDEVMPGMTMPCLLFSGTADSRYTIIRDCAGRIPHATFYALPNLTHVGCLTRIDLVLPPLVEFLRSVNTSSTHATRSPMKVAKGLFVT